MTANNHLLHQQVVTQQVVTSDTFFKIPLNIPSQNPAFLSAKNKHRPTLATTVIPRHPNTETEKIFGPKKKIPQNTVHLRRYSPGCRGIYRLSSVISTPFTHLFFGHLPLGSLTVRLCESRPKPKRKGVFVSSNHPFFRKFCAIKLRAIFIGALTITTTTTTPPKNKRLSFFEIPNAVLPNGLQRPGKSTGRLHRDRSLNLRLQGLWGILPEIEVVHGTEKRNKNNLEYGCQV